MNSVILLKFRTIIYFFVSCLLLLHPNSIEAKSIAVLAPQPIYWIDGSGEWDDPNHWSKDSGGTPSGYIPEAGFNAVFDNNSGLTSSSTVTIPGGNHYVNDFNVLTSAAFNLNFVGASGDKASMNIYGNLELTANMSVTYTSASLFHNEWNFVDNIDHDITTSGQDLLHVQFLEENAEYNQLDDLEASKRIRHYGGTWNTNNHEVNSELLLFKDNNSSNNQLTKVFNAGTSNIYCDKWDSKLTYGSLMVAGTYSVYVAEFIGSPANSGTSFVFHNIYLLEYPDNPSGGSSIIEHNNFVCTDCIVNKIIIEDTGLTKLYGKFTVENLFEVTNLGSTIAFNGGNGNSDEVVFNGNVMVPNIQDCEGRTIFTNIHNDFTTMIRATGTLTIENSILTNIHTQGGANFQVSNSVLTGSSTGWTENNFPNSLFYVWIGNGTIADWDDPNNWELDTGESNGCIPSIVDHVLINSAAISDINIPSGFTAECKDFIWKNSTGLELKLSGTISTLSALKVVGKFTLHPSAIITPINSHEINFNSSSDNDITTNDVQLPKVRFEGSNGQWNLKDKLNATDIYFEGGTLITESNDIETDYWSSTGTESKTYYFGSSHIKVNGEFKLSQYSNSNVTVYEGNSLYECEKLTSTVPNMYDLKLNNTFTFTLNNYPYVMHDLILNSVHLARTSNDIELNNLIFNVDDSKFDIDPLRMFTMNGGFESNASAANPGILNSRIPGLQAEINKAEGNICATGNIRFEDINANLTGVLHAPQGIDDGNNSNINFDNGNTSSTLYWIAGSGNWSEVTNWARVSGGCPSTKNPDDSPQLMFDNNGIYPNARTITVDGSHTANSMTVKNINNAMLIVQTSLIVDDLLVDGGYATLQNKNMVVNNTVTVQNGGFLVVDLLSLTAGGISGLGGYIILKQGTDVEIIE